MVVADLRGRRWLRPLGVALLVLLTIVDVVLIRLALEHVDRPMSPDRNITESSPSARTPEPSPSIPPTSPSASNPTALPDGPVLLAVGSDGTVLRAAVGDCSAGDEAQVGVARPQSPTWRALPVAPDLAEVLAVRANAREDLVVVGADEECRISGYGGAAGRRIWAPRPAQEEWYLDVTQDPEVVHAPGGPVEVPCVPVALSTLDAVRVLCDGGALLGTGDGGETWAALGRVDDASAMAFQGPSRGIALAEREDCPVTVLVTENGGAGWEATTCLEGEAGRAVALRGETAVALVDDVLWRSADGGETWERSTG